MTAEEAAQKDIKKKAIELAQCFYQRFSEADCTSNPECNILNENSKRLTEAVLNLVEAEKKEAVKEFKGALLNYILGNVEYGEVYKIIDLLTPEDK